MSPREAATATGIDRLTILKWVRDGRLVAERVQTARGPGYDIRPEDLTQALQQPRKKRDPKPPTITGSTLDELQQIKAMLEAQNAMLEAQKELIEAMSQAHAAEIHDLRGQLHQTEQRLTENLRALPAPKRDEPEPKRGPISKVIGFLRGSW